VLNVDSLILYSYPLSLMNILPVNLKQNKTHSNPAILNLKSKLNLALTADHFSDSVNKNMLLISYANSIFSLSLDEIAFKYGNNVRIPIAKYNLPEDWDLLRNYKGIPGIYLCPALPPFGALRYARLREQ
jgi:hypothetical protein